MGNECCLQQEKRKIPDYIYLPIIPTIQDPISGYKDEGSHFEFYHAPSTLNSNVSNNQYASELFKNIERKEECSRCSSIIEADSIKAPCGSKKCKSHFHKDCFEKHINNQIIYKEALCFKCMCGCKIPTGVIRCSSIKNKMKLLANVFTNQIKIIPQNHQFLRHDIETLQNITYDLENKRESDFILVDSDNEVNEDFYQ